MISPEEAKASDYLYLLTVKQGEAKRDAKGATWASKLVFVADASGFQLSPLAPVLAAKIISREAPFYDFLTHNCYAFSFLLMHILESAFSTFFRRENNPESRETGKTLGGLLQPSFMRKEVKELAEKMTLIFVKEWVMINRSQHAFIGVTQELLGQALGKDITVVSVIFNAFALTQPS